MIRHLNLICCSFLIFCSVNVQGGTRGSLNDILARQKRSRSQTGHCRDLTSADAPQNGALVCHEYQQYKYCAPRCNAGFELTKNTNFFEACGPSTEFQWTFQGRIDDCVPEFFPDMQLDDNIYYLDGACNDLSVEDQLDTIQWFNEDVLGRIPVLQHGSVRSGQLICHNPNITVRECRDLSADDAPRNGALVCTSHGESKYCAYRCNDGFEPVRRATEPEFLSCSPSTNYNWYDLPISSCVENFDKEERFSEDNFYLPYGSSCGSLTEDQKTTVKRTFRTILRESDSSKHYGPVQNMTIFCGETDSSEDLLSF